MSTQYLVCFLLFSAFFVIIHLTTRSLTLINVTSIHSLSSSIKMRIQNVYGAFLILPCFFSIVSSQCLENQKDLLIELRNNLKYDPSLSTKLIHWNESSDCCQWNGVRCDVRGHVTGVDLSSESISGQIDALFKFKSLQKLNLAQNSFDSAFPAEFGNFSNLSYLNLSSSGFTGQIPLQLSKLTRLVVLDLSSGYASLFLENPSLRTLVQSFTGLRELYLNGVNISASGFDWCNAVSSLHNLRVLSLSNAYLTGPLDSSLTKLKSLEVIRLDENPFSSPLPEFFADFRKLRVLSISSSDLTGFVPKKLFQIPSLQTIDLSNNRILQGSFPEFPVNSSLQNILLSVTNLSGSVPESIKRLKLLSQFNIRVGNFSGSIPNSFTGLTRLVKLDLSANHFSGPVPSFNSLRNLQTINLEANHLSGHIPGALFEGLEKLSFLSLTQNSIEGEVPSSLFVLPSLEDLHLSNNRFSGSIRDLGSNSSLSLEVLQLDSNDLRGTIPRFLFNLHNLSRLSLAWNNLSGSVDLTEFQKLSQLFSLDLSHNSFSIHIQENVSIASLFPRLNYLNLASCKLQRIPNLRNQPSLLMLDLSENNIKGEIPNWLWEINDGFLRFLNLSHNQFTTLQQPYRFPWLLESLYLHSNKLGGQVPLPPRSARVVEFSSNNFSSALPPNIGNFLKFADYFSVANNKISGTIPTSLCNASHIQLLDLSNNSLSGRIPSCIVPETLHVLNLRRNGLSGNIPDSFPLNCGLETLDLSWNHLQGKVPVSLSRCSELKVLNLGHNNLSDTFPCFRNSSHLSVIALRSNRFYGNISCLSDNNTRSSLQILDLANNKFGGVIPANLFSNLRAMTENGTQILDHLKFASFATNQIYYQDSVTVTFKAQNIELQKILTIFTSIDFSRNHFQGVIPETVGHLDLLYVLNFSHNSLSGSIPSSFGNLKTLESLDLSSNTLDGKVPEELASLTFLSFLNLSDNHLTGRIPQGRQFQTFVESSFTGNAGLCGFPLSKNCSIMRAQPESREEQKTSNYEIYVGVALGFLVGLSVFYAPLLFSKRWRKWYNTQLNNLVLLVAGGHIYEKRWFLA